jgi:hypothetical protein
MAGCAAARTAAFGNHGVYAVVDGSLHNAGANSGINFGFCAIVANK